MRHTFVIAFALSLVLNVVASRDVMVARAQEATPSTASTPCPITTSEENTALVARHFAEVWNRGEIDVVNEIYAASIIQHYTPTGQGEVGVDAAKERIRERRLVDFPDLRVTVDHEIAENDLVVTRSTWTGTHSDELEHYPACDTTPTGRTITWTATGLHRIACGYVAEQWWSVDNRALLQQIGAIAAPAGASTPTGAATSPAAAAPEVSVPASPAASCATTLNEDEAVIRRLYDEVLSGEHDLHVVAEIHAADHVFSGPSGRPNPSGIDAQRERYREWLSDIPDRTTTVEAVVRDADTIAVRWTAEGSHEGDYEQFNVPGDGRRVRFGGISLYRIACDRIDRTWSHYDTLGLHQQLVGVPVVATPAA